MNYVSRKLEGITVFNPMPPRRFDLVHAFNRIPLGTTPFIIGFEDYLPRAFGLEHTSYYRWLRNMLASGRCRKIIAISDHARTVFKSLHDSSPQAQELCEKLSLLYPNVDIPEVPDALAEHDHSEFVVTFVGNDFGRKGGCVAVKLAEMALAKGFPLKVEIVSSLNMGGAVWTDPVSSEFFDRYRALLDLPNVTVHGRLGNAEVKSLLARSHFSVLTTLGDTFGFSAIESMAYWTPVIATRQGALPEFIRHLDNGLLIDLETSAIGQWVHQSSPERASKRFEKIFEDEMQRIANETFALLVELAGQPQKIREMRRRARQTCIEMFDSERASRSWDALYEDVVGHSQASLVSS
ncbi:MAG TPA: glycosyltransferase family 4 protein [Hyphomicrobium sp.]|nr:glycosyltransferase family 4 protein [Hyphomicrobium sp.]